MYRLLEVGEVIEKGDEYWEEKIGWKAATFSVGQKLHIATPVRRKVAEPSGKFTPRSVSVGDRVKVLSGPWAGCTGVVIEFEVEVSVKPWGEMTAMKDSTPVIRLDNVHAGGSPLVVKESKVEKLPQVVPEVLYRDLAIGEAIRKGDEVWAMGCGPWKAIAKSRYGDRINLSHTSHRRPVRIQSSGWRYLDAGEMVQAGDEAGFHCAPFWRPVLEHFSEGYVVRGLDKEHSETFRRKLPTNQGG